MLALQKYLLRIKTNRSVIQSLFYLKGAIAFGGHETKASNFSSGRIFNSIFFNRPYSTNINNRSLPQIKYEKICEETLESLAEFFEELVESQPNLAGADVSYSDGVLTIYLGKELGTYVINRQSPNKQIWLSSPISGPKRYDFDVNDQTWIYKHDFRTLHDLLQNEISKLLQSNIELTNCCYSKLKT